VHRARRRPGEVQDSTAEQGAICCDAACYDSISGAKQQPAVLRHEQRATLRKYQTGGAFRAFAARALRVASLLHVPRAAIIPAASDDRNTGQGGTETADKGADQREGLCARDS
jgi:hypothetical protein